MIRSDGVGAVRATIFSMQESIAHSNCVLTAAAIAINVCLMNVCQFANKAFLYNRAYFRAGMCLPQRSLHYLSSLQGWTTVKA